VQDGQFAGLTQFIQNPAVHLPALFGDAVEVALRVHQQTGVAGIFPIFFRASRESVQNGLFATRTYLEQPSVVGRAALRSGAVQITRLSRSRPPMGMIPSPPPVKLCRTVSVPLGSTLNTTPALAEPPHGSCSIQVARTVPNHR
jgi:hypothetical protein